jgi:hypothetical protein
MESRCLYTLVRASALKFPCDASGHQDLADLALRRFYFPFPIYTKTVKPRQQPAEQEIPERGIVRLRVPFGFPLVHFFPRRHVVPDESWLIFSLPDFLLARKERAPVLVEQWPELFSHMPAL